MPLSLYLIADFDTEVGLNLIKEALTSIVRLCLGESHRTSCYPQEPGSLTRISFVHNPSAPFTDEVTEKPHISSLVAHLVATNALSKATPSRLLRALGLDSPAAPNYGPQTVLSQQDTLNELTGGVASDDFSAEAYAQFTKSSRLVARELQLGPGQQALLINGRVSVPHISPRLILKSCDEGGWPLRRRGIRRRRLQSLAGV